MTRHPQYHDHFEPVYPCRVMPTRHCPAMFESTCDNFEYHEPPIATDAGTYPCARYESDEEWPWLPEVE